MYRQPSKDKILDSKQKKIEYNKLKCKDVVDLLSWKPQVPPSEREKLRRIRLWEKGLISGNFLTSDEVEECFGVI